MNPVEFLEAFVKFLDEKGVALFILEDGDLVPSSYSVGLVDEFIVDYYRKKNK